MPFCPRCESEYKEGIAECADCKVALVAQLPRNPDTAEDDEDWVQVGVGDFGGVSAAEAALESAGIETKAPDEFMAGFAPLSTSMGFYSFIWVRKSDEQDAKEILKGLDRIDADAPPTEPESK